MKNFTKYFMFALCCSAAVGTTNAQSNSEGCYGTSVVEFTQGLRVNGQPVAANRSNPDNALGVPDRSNAADGFVSLGINGTITIAFGGDVYDEAGADIMVYETSFSGDTCGRSDDESATIEVTQDGTTWVAAGALCRDGAIDLAGLGLDYVTQIKITDTSSNANGDGYDVDGVEAVNGCQPISARRCFGGSVVVDSYQPGLMSNGNPITDPERLDPSKALGEPQNDDTNNFVSLGYGGQITIAFEGVVMNNPGNDLEVTETTFGSPSFEDYPESADIYVSQNGVDFYFIGEALTSEDDDLDISNAPLFLEFIKYVRIVDTTPEGSVSTDGYDLDGISALQGCADAPIVVQALCNATDVLEYVEGTTKNGGTIPAVRTNPENALGDPEGTDTNVFTTLGYGGSLKVSFDGAVLNGPGPDLVFVETSFNQPLGCADYREYADIYVSFDDFTYRYAGTVCKSNNAIDISNAGDYEYINFVKVVNNDTLSTTPDGYDLDGIIAVFTCVSFSQSSILTSGSLLATDETASREVEFSAYPNPTTGVSNIMFNAPESGKMTIEAYDLLGRNVATVFNEEVIASENYTVSFDGSNLPNGMYLYRVTIGGNTSVKKFVIAH